MFIICILNSETKLEVQYYQKENELLSENLSTSDFFQTSDFYLLDLYLTTISLLLLPNISATSKWQKPVHALAKVDLYAHSIVSKLLTNKTQSCLLTPSQRHHRTPSSTQPSILLKLLDTHLSSIFLSPYQIWVRRFKKLLKKLQQESNGTKETKILAMKI